ncbi:hypothetical protein AB0O47_32520 [Streptomyces noursei]|uniref:hypothetical protein n=1 Tax=Streptomyces noursei TaxID=1971 RepID=UPI00344EC5CE
MSRVTRCHTIAGHLASGGLTPLSLTGDQQRKGPEQCEHDGFAVRQHRDAAGSLIVIAGAYGPNWLRTLSEVVGRLEQPHLKCTVIRETPEAGDHEVLVRWATSDELQARKRAEAERRAPLVALLRKQEDAERAAAERQALEDAGQSGLW